jgi:hypothetical protein
MVAYLDDNVGLSETGRCRVDVLVWNYDDESAAPAEIKLTVKDLPQAVRHALLEHY